MNFLFTHGTKTWSLYLRVSSLEGSSSDFVAEPKETEAPSKEPRALTGRLAMMGSAEIGSSLRAWGLSPESGLSAVRFIHQRESLRGGLESLFHFESPEEDLEQSIETFLTFSLQKLSSLSWKVPASPSSGGTLEGTSASSQGPRSSQISVTRFLKGVAVSDARAGIALLGLVHACPLPLLAPSLPKLTAEAQRQRGVSPQLVAERLNQRGIATIPDCIPRASVKALTRLVSARIDSMLARLEKLPSHVPHRFAEIMKRDAGRYDMRLSLDEPALAPFGTGTGGTVATQLRLIRREAGPAQNRGPQVYNGQRRGRTDASSEGRAEGGQVSQAETTPPSRHVQEEEDVLLRAPAAEAKAAAATASSSSISPPPPMGPAPAWLALAEALRRILGPDCVLYRAGCVFSTPGTAVQYWHCDGSHMAPARSFGFAEEKVAALTRVWERSGGSDRSAAEGGKKSGDISAEKKCRDSDDDDEEEEEEGEEEGDIESSQEIDLQQSSSELEPDQAQALCVFLPLIQLTEQTGYTSFWPGSHLYDNTDLLQHDFPSRCPWVIQKGLASPGDALIYDFRFVRSSPPASIASTL